MLCRTAVSGSPSSPRSRIAVTFFRGGRFRYRQSALGGFSQSAALLSSRVSCSGFGFLQPCWRFLHRFFADLVLLLMLDSRNFSPDLEVYFRLCFYPPP